MSGQTASRLILGLWIGSMAVVVWHEWGAPGNPGAPLPRPCKLIPGAVGYTGLGLLADVMPPIAALLAVAITLGELVSQGGLYGPAATVLYQVSTSINRQVASAPQAGAV